MTSRISITPLHEPNSSELDALKVPALRIAAAADFHIGQQRYPLNFLESVNSRADVLLLCGDMTDFGRPDQWAHALELIRQVRIPTFLIFGNHDRITDGFEEFRTELNSLPHVTLLEGGYHSLHLKGLKIGITGNIGSEGGFGEELATAVGPETAREIQEKESQELECLQTCLRKMQYDNPDFHLALMHYVPFAEGVRNQEPGTCWLYGSSKFGELLDQAHVDFVAHGHLHNGEKGILLSSGRTCFANVALPNHENQLSFFDIELSSF